MTEETFQERFCRKYKERMERTRREYAERNRLFDDYKRKVGELFETVEREVDGTPITVERQPVDLERQISIFESRHEAFESLILKLQEFEIRFVPEGLNYRTGAATVRIEHNNPREQPQTLYLHLRLVRKNEKESEGELRWMIKIGYRNFSTFSRELLERLIEGIFLS